MIRSLNIKSIPSNAGVYFFRDKHGRILYIGKAANLKNRLKSYFNSSPKDNRISKMLEEATKITWQETDSEIEALILEAQLIKKQQPPFNVMLRDDKQYFYLLFTKEEFVRILITHRPEATKKIADTVIGPFTDGNALKITLRLLRRIFPYCTCKQKHNNYCLNYHIGNCPGFCCLKNHKVKTKKQELINYKRNIKAIQYILTGEKDGFIKKLKKEMALLAKKHSFTKAIALRDKIEKLERVFHNAQIISKSNPSYFDKSIYQSKNVEKTLRELKKSLGLLALPIRIESYDISNIQGQFATGAMVVFTNGQPNKSQYRKFKIRIAGIPNDTAMLREILTRRLNHPEWPLADLIIVDGGKPQLNTVTAVLNKKSIPIIALTKNDRHRGDHIFIANKKTAIPLKDLPPAVKNLILKIDAEAHRFAISYYRKLHQANTILHK